MKRTLALALCLTMSTLLASCGQSAGTEAAKSAAESGGTAVESSSDQSGKNNSTGKKKNKKKSQSEPEDFDACNILQFEHNDIVESTLHDGKTKQEYSIATTDWLITNNGEHSIDQCTVSYGILKKDGSYSEKQGSASLDFPLIPNIAKEERSTTSNVRDEIIPYSDVKDIEIQSYQYVLAGKEYTVDLQKKTATSKESKTWQPEDFNTVNILGVTVGDISFDEQSKQATVPFTFVNNGQDIVDEIHPYSYFTSKNDESVMTVHSLWYNFSMAPGKSLNHMEMNKQVDEEPFAIQYDDVKDFGMAGYRYSSGDRIYQVYLKDQTASSQKIRDVLPYDESKDILKDILSITPTLKDDQLHISATINGNLNPAPKDDISLSISLLDNEGNCFDDDYISLSLQKDGTYSTDPSDNLSYQDVHGKNFATCQLTYYEYNVADPSSDSNGCDVYTVYPESKRLVGIKYKR